MTKCTSSLEGRLYPGLYQKQCEQQGEGGDSLPLLCSAVVRLLLECSVQVWGSQHKKDGNLSSQGCTPWKQGYESRPMKTRRDLGLEEKALVRPYSTFWYLKEAAIELERNFHKCR